MTYETIKTGSNCAWQRKTADDQMRLVGKSSGQKSYYGHKIESQAAIIDSLVIAGRFTIAEMAANACFKTGKIAESRVKQHIYAKLRDKLNCNIQIDKKGRVYDKSNVASAENNRLVNEAEKIKTQQVIAGAVKHIAAKAKLAKIDQKRRTA